MTNEELISRLTLAGMPRVWTGLNLVWVADPAWIVPHGGDLLLNALMPNYLERAGLIIQHRTGPHLCFEFAAVVGYHAAPWIYRVYGRADTSWWDWDAEVSSEELDAGLKGGLWL